MARSLPASRRMADVGLDAGKHIVAAVDATKHSLDPLALGKLLGDTTGARVDVVSIFPYFPLADPSGLELTRLSDEARAFLRGLAAASGLRAAEVEAIPGNCPRASSSG